jgi:hypothetical protein
VSAKDFDTELKAKHTEGRKLVVRINSPPKRDRSPKKHKGYFAIAVNGNTENT